ncbi:MAG: hypothetical protein WAL85_00245 [Candidatus Korobacteraceae bacterium]
MPEESEMLKKPAKLAALVTLLLFSAAAFARLLPDGQATTPTQTNAQSSASSGNQKKNVSQKDTDKAAKDKATQEQAAKDKLAKEDQLSKERYSTRGLHPADKSSGSKTASDSSKQNPQAAGKSDAKDTK